MHTKILRGEVPLTEPVPVEDTLCSALGLIEDLKWAARFVLYRESTVYETGDTVPVVSAKIILPYAAIVPGLDMTGRFAAKKALTPARDVIRLIRSR